MGGLGISIAGAITSGFVSMFTVETLKYLAYRAMLIVAIWTVLPWAIFRAMGYTMKFIVPYMMDQFSSLGQSVMGDNLQAQVVALYGVGAYLGDLMRINEGCSIFLTWLIFKFAWGLLPKPMGMGGR